ncbi:electron transfer flavoprotein subunit alpha/FixB family protein [Paraburkholderia phosphatilytica]|uniref:electron transfer flavoprotein subunit alpha/FixB family protein n=1 Tax=Paraburkholderia phosphatilytica TaxID=2282883 RepID=UPI000E4AB71F|nr:electron transfer flavoprotein subunit alpha/FixB family protein [Paraburkholderia phosphatilytica]
MSILVVAEHDNASLKTSTRTTITAALQLGDDVQVLVAGWQAEAVAAEAAAIVGVRKVLVAEAPHLAAPTAESLEPLLCGIARTCSHMLFPATSFGKNVAPRVAARLDVAQVSDVVAVHGPATFDRLMYAGSIVATVQCDEPVRIVTVRTTTFEATRNGDGRAPVERIDASAENPDATVIARESASHEHPDLLSARVVVAGGRGLASKDQFAALLAPLAERLDAALGASRAAVDEGYAPGDCQVGQTGKIVAPELYIAVGVSGAVQHLAGMKGSKVIVAINKDPEAPIFSVADYGLVGDLFAVVPELSGKLA